MTQLSSFMPMSSGACPTGHYIRNGDGLRPYGQAIKDMASCNIFPGDMLLKNLRCDPSPRPRSCSTDYDELCLLEECNFPRLPPPERYEDSMAEPWFHVKSNDIFPEEFAHFLWVIGRPSRKEFGASSRRPLHDRLLARRGRSHSPGVGPHLPLSTWNKDCKWTRIMTMNYRRLGKPGCQRAVPWLVGHLQQSWPSMRLWKR